MGRMIRRIYRGPVDPSGDFADRNIDCDDIPLRPRCLKETGDRTRAKVLTRGALMSIRPRALDPNSERFYDVFNNAVTAYRISQRRGSCSFNLVSRLQMS